jgi:hypothetical protein
MAVCGHLVKGEEFGLAKVTVISKPTGPAA